MIYIYIHMCSPKEGHTRTPGPTEASSSRWVLGCSPDLPVREGSWLGAHLKCSLGLIPDQSRFPSGQKTERGLGLFELGWPDPLVGWAGNSFGWPGPFLWAGWRCVKDSGRCESLFSC